MSREVHPKVSLTLIIKCNLRCISSLMKKILILTSLLFFIYTNFTLSQVKLKPVAKVGNEEISSKEFKVRYELMPRISKDYFSVDSLKKEFLHSLIAEKLWAEEARSEGLDTLEYLNYFIKYLEKLMVKDALYKEEVDSKIKITDKDVAQAERRSTIKLNLDILSSADSMEILKVYSLLKENVPVESIEASGKTEGLQSANNSISFGDIDDETIEDSLYKLKVGQFTQPIKNDYGWFIFKLENKSLVDTSVHKNTTPPREIKKIIRERRAKKIGMPYLNKLLYGIKVDINEKLFWMLVDKFTNALQKREKRVNDSTKAEVYSLVEYDILNLVSKMNKDTLNMTFIPITKDPIPLKEFLYDLIPDGFDVKNPDTNLVASKLNSIVKQYTQNQLITQEGYRQGLQKSADIKAELKMWRENYLASILRKNKLKDFSVSEDEVRNEYNRIYHSSAPVTEVNIIEILTDKLDVIQLVLNKLKEGADFKELAKKYSIRESTKATGGEFGFFPVTAHGEIGRQAAKMKVGDIYGPLKLAEGYSIFKLIGKREAATPTAKTYDEVKGSIKEDLLYQKFMKYFNTYTGKLADKFGITIYQKNLNAVEVTNISMMTYRYIGFGGVMTATPFTDSWYEWYDMWKNSKKVNP